MPKNQKKEEGLEKNPKKKLDKIADLLTELFKKEDEFYLKNKKEER